MVGLLSTFGVRSSRVEGGREGEEGGRDDWEWLVTG